MHTYPASSRSRAVSACKRDLHTLPAWEVTIHLCIHYWKGPKNILRNTEESILIEECQIIQLYFAI
jgi:hypothetical protein